MADNNVMDYDKLAKPAHNALTINKHVIACYSMLLIDYSISFEGIITLIR